LCKPRFKLLGYNATQEGLEANEDKVEAIINYPVPADHKELSSFLGLVSWCRRFIYRCSQRMRHMRAASRDSHFAWGPDQQKEFEMMRTIIAKIPTLIYPDSKRHFIYI